MKELSALLGELKSKHFGNLMISKVGKHITCNKSRQAYSVGLSNVYDSVMYTELKIA